MFEIGRVCMKTAGREAGKYCVVLKKEDPGFVLVTGPRSLTKVKRRKCNVHHLEPLVEKVKIKAEASDAEVLSALKSGKLLEKLGIKEIKIAKTSPKVEKKEAKKAEKKESKPVKKEIKKAEKKK